MLFQRLTAGSVVRFMLKNVLCPDMEDVTEKLTGSLELTGRVILMSDEGQSKDAAKSQS